MNMKITKVEPVGDGTEFVTFASWWGLSKVRMLRRTITRTDGATTSLWIDDTGCEFVRLDLHGLWQRWAAEQQLEGSTR